MFLVSFRVTQLRDAESRDTPKLIARGSNHNRQHVVEATDCQQPLPVVQDEGAGQRWTCVLCACAETSLDIRVLWHVSLPYIERVTSVLHHKALGCKSIQ